MPKLISPGEKYDLFNANPVSEIVNDYKEELVGKDTTEQIDDKIIRNHHEIVVVHKHNEETGKEEIAEAVRGNANSVSLTDQARENIEGATVTFSHPQAMEGGRSGTFCFSEIQTLLLNPKEIRTVSAEGVYTMSPDKNADVQGFLEFSWTQKEQIESELEAIHQKCKRKMQRGEYPSMRAFERDNENKQFEYVHEYYKKNTPNFGIDYSFKEDKNFRPMDPQRNVKTLKRDVEY